MQAVHIKQQAHIKRGTKGQFTGFYTRKSSGKRMFTVKTVHTHTHTENITIPLHDVKEEATMTTTRDRIIGPVLDRPFGESSERSSTVV